LRYVVMLQPGTGFFVMKSKNPSKSFLMKCSRPELRVRIQSKGSVSEPRPMCLNESFGPQKQPRETSMMCSVPEFSAALPSGIKSSRSDSCMPFSRTTGGPSMVITECSKLLAL